MPIVGAPVEGSTRTEGSTTIVGTWQRGITYNASAYSHSTVFVISEDNPQVTQLFAPALTKIFTPPPECVNRWMLVGDQTWTRFITHNQTLGATRSQSIASPTSGTIDPLTTSLTRADSADFSFIDQELTIFNLNLNGTATDPSYTSCLPYRASPTYSPGVCPSGQTIAEVTAWQVSGSISTRTFWQASCCRSGMGFGPEFPDVCISTFSTPIQVHALMTITSGTSYLHTIIGYDSSRSQYTTSTSSSIVTVSTGLAVEDPIVVAWQIEDLSTFPPDYATSLAKRISIALPLKTGDRSAETGTPNPGISTGAKAGIGAGVALGALAILSAIVLLFLRRKRKRKANATPPEHSKPELDGQTLDAAKKKWWFFSEADSHSERQELDSKAMHAEVHAETDPQELENKTVRIVPGPPVELDSAELQHPLDAGRAVLR